MTNRSRSTIGTIALVLLGWSTAHAARSLTTAPAYRIDRSMACNATNAGDRPVTIDIQAIDANGTVNDEAAGIVLVPNAASGTIMHSTEGAPFVYCKIVVKAGDRKSVRGNLCVFNADGNACEALEPAR